MYPQAYLDEMQNERDMKKMKELYPEVAKDVLSVVEDECDQMEYDGSMMFDEMCIRDRHGNAFNGHLFL